MYEKSNVALPSATSIDLRNAFVSESDLSKNRNAPRPSEHPPVRGENMSKRSGQMGSKAANTKPLHGT